MDGNTFSRCSSLLRACQPPWSGNEAHSAADHSQDRSITVHLRAGRAESAPGRGVKLSALAGRPHGQFQRWSRTAARGIFISPTAVDTLLPGRKPASRPDPGAAIDGIGGPTDTFRLMRLHLPTPKRLRRLACVAAGMSILAAGAAGVGATAVPQPAAAATSTCTVAYSVTNSWPGGFQAGITITNNGAAITSWALAFTFPDDQQVSGGWDGTYTQSGQYLTVTSESWNGALATGGAVTIGFTGTVGSTNAVPSYFTVNGYACNGAAQVPSVNIT